MNHIKFNILQLNCDSSNQTFSYHIGLIVMRFHGQDFYTILSKEQWCKDLGHAPNDAPPALK